MRTVKHRKWLRFLLILFVPIFLSGGILAHNSGLLRLAGTIRIAPEQWDEMPRWEGALPPSDIPGNGGFNGGFFETTSPSALSFGITHAEPDI